MNYGPILTGEAHDGEERFDFAIKRFVTGGFLLEISYSGDRGHGINGAGVWPSIEKAKEIAQQTANRLLHDASISWNEILEIRRKPKPGDSVILKECPPGLLDELPIEDQRAISTIIGKPVQLNEYDDDGRAEIEFTDADGVIHFLFVSPDIISIA